MSYERISLRGTLTFDVILKIEDGEPRPVPYCHPDRPMNYRVETLEFVLISGSNDDGKHPRYKDLSVDCVTLSGHKLKADGSLSVKIATEQWHTYTPTNWPTWVQAVMEETVRELRG